MIKSWATNPKTPAQKTVFYFLFGTNKIQWVTSLDDKVRQSHVNIPALIISEVNPPFYINCRCTSIKLPNNI